MSTHLLLAKLLASVAAKHLVKRSMLLMWHKVLHRLVSKEGSTLVRVDPTGKDHTMCVPICGWNAWLSAGADSRTCKRSGTLKLKFSMSDKDHHSWDRTHRVRKSFASARGIGTFIPPLKCTRVCEKLMYKEL